MFQQRPTYDTSRQRETGSAGGQPIMKQDSSCSRVDVSEMKQRRENDRVRLKTSSRGGERVRHCRGRPKLVHLMTLYLCHSPALAKKSLLLRGSRGKNQLLLIRPYKKIVLHSMYYGNEVRDFNLVPKAQNVTGIGLIVRLTFGRFRPRITKTNIAFEYWRRRMRKQSKETVIATAPCWSYVFGSFGS
jgi:hypothetical protein